MIGKLYGIDYSTYVTGGINNMKLRCTGSNTIFFYTESEMLEALVELKEDYTVGEIVPFVTPIIREEYQI